MSSLVDDIQALLGHIAHSHNEWNAAVTVDPERLRREHGFPCVWRQWDAKYISVAALLEEYLRAKGVRLTSDREIGATHVCIFKHDRVVAGGVETAGSGATNSPDIRSISV